MQTLSTEELQEMRFENQDILLVNTLSPAAFEARHIPGSVNVPQDRDNFVEEIQNHAGGKHRKIVLYCANFECQSSAQAAEKLQRAQFQNVYDYEGGVQAWADAGENVETGVPSS